MSGPQPLTQDQVEEFRRVSEEFYQSGNEQSLRRLFSLLDRNGDGRISRPELTVTMRSVSEGSDDSEVDDMIREADTNLDGYIDITEFIRVMQKHR